MTKELLMHEYTIRVHSAAESVSDLSMRMLRYILQSSPASPSAGFKHYPLVRRCRRDQTFSSAQLRLQKRHLPSSLSAPLSRSLEGPELFVSRYRII